MKLCNMVWKLALLAIASAGNRKGTVLFFVLGGLLVGCASVSYQPVVDANAKSSGGIPYFDSSPYLLMQKDTNDAWNAQLIYLPDEKKKSEINIWTLLSVNNTSFSFTNGILTDASAELDSSAVPAAFVQAAATAAAGLLKLSEGKEQGLGVQLFKIVKSKDTWGLVGAGAPPYEEMIGRPE